MRAESEVGVAKFVFYCQRHKIIPLAAWYGLAFIVN